MNWIDDVKHAGASPDKTLVSREWLEGCTHDAPYCVTPLLIYLKSNGVKGNEDVLARLAIAFPDRQALARMLGEGAAAFAGFYPPDELPDTPDTITAIDRFLDNYGNTAPGEVEAIDRAIFNPMPDYADVLAAQEMEEGGTQPAAGDSQDELISKFIAQQAQRGQEAAAQAPPAAPIAEEEKAEIAGEKIEEPDIADDSMLSESLAKMYISRHKYSQALEIIKQLSLKYPEKSIYFADQIRFLTKLVLNETLNDKK